MICQEKNWKLIYYDNKLGSPCRNLLLKTGLKDVSSQSCNSSIILRILQQVESTLQQPNMEIDNKQYRFVLWATPQPYHILFILANIRRFSSFGWPFRLAKSSHSVALKSLQTDWGSKQPYSWNCSTSLRMLYYANNWKKNRWHTYMWRRPKEP